MTIGNFTLNFLEVNKFPLKEEMTKAIHYLQEYYRKLEACDNDTYLSLQFPL